SSSTSSSSSQTSNDQPTTVPSMAGMGTHALLLKSFALLGSIAIGTAIILVV
ncbi:9154_t:CDS:1, partial [Paraglomus occultum]